MTTKEAREPRREKRRKYERPAISALEVLETKAVICSPGKALGQKGSCRNKPFS